LRGEVKGGGLTDKKRQVQTEVSKGDRNSDRPNGQTEGDQSRRGMGKEN